MPRRRKDPLRRPIPPPKAKMFRAAYFPTVPVEKSNWWMSRKVGAAQRVLQVVLSMHRQVLNDKLFQNSLDHCYEVGRALSLLGYESRIYDVDVRVIDSQSQTVFTTLDGETAAIFRPSKSSGLLSILSVPAFDRWIDPTLFMQPGLRRLLRSRPDLSLPIFFETGRADVQTRGMTISTIRAEYVLQYRISHDALMDDPSVRLRNCEAAERNSLITAWRSLSAILAYRNMKPDEVVFDACVLRRSL